MGAIAMPLRCRILGHRWGEWRYDSFYDAWHRPCRRTGCIHGEMTRVVR